VAHSPARRSSAAASCFSISRVRSSTALAVSAALANSFRNSARAPSANANRLACNSSCWARRTSACPFAGFMSWHDGLNSSSLHSDACSWRPFMSPTLSSANSRCQECFARVNWSSISFQSWSFNLIPLLRSQSSSSVRFDNCSSNCWMWRLMRCCKASILRFQTVSGSPLC